MISTFITEHFLLVRIVLVVGVVGAIVLAGVLAGAGRTGRRVAAGIAAAAVLVVLGLTLTPDTPSGTTVTCNLEPYRIVGDEFNIALFLLPALFAVIASRRPGAVLAVAVGLSLVIEVVQATAPSLGRRCDIDDWLANSVGAVTGVLLAMVVLALVDKVGQRRRAGRPG